MIASELNERLYHGSISSRDIKLALLDASLGSQERLAQSRRTFRAERRSIISRCKLLLPLRIKAKED